MSDEVLLHVGALPGGAGRARSVSIHDLAVKEALPLPSASARAVYIARALEYLDTPAALRALLEARRVLAPDGRLILVLPDFDRALDCWRRRDPSVCSDEWRDDSAAFRAPGSQTAPCSLDHRAAAIFCTFAKGDPSDGHDNVGPPLLDAEALRELSAAPTPFRLSCMLRRMVIDQEARFRFRRRNAWGRRELADLLGLVGFRVQSFDEEAVFTEVSAAMGARLERRSFMCCLAEPVGSRASGLAVEAEAGAEAWLRRGGELAGTGDLRGAMKCYRRAVAIKPEMGAAHYQLLWDTHARLVRLETSGSTERVDPSFSRLGYKQGRVTERALAAFLDALAAAPASPLEADDFAPGYAHYAGLSAEGLRVINADHTFLDLGALPRRALAPLLGELRRPLEECAGTPFRFINMRCWKTRPRALATETNEWHNDEGCPASVLKVMVYLSGAGEETGSTELVLSDGSRVLASGPPGAFLIFKNLELVHRGVSPATRERAVLELTIAPWTDSDLRPVHAGLNAEFPWVPWHRHEDALGQDEAPLRSAAQADDKVDRTAL